MNHHPNKVRIDESNSTFRDRVAKRLGIKIRSDELQTCVWEEVYKTINQEGRTMRDHLATATAQQDMCLATVLIRAKQTPDSDIIEAAAAGNNSILSLYLHATTAGIPYQALLTAVDANNVANVVTLLRDGRAPVDPPSLSKPSLLKVAVKNNNMKMINILLEESRLDPSGSDNDALYTAAYDNNVPAMNLLMENGANPNIGKSPFVAASVGNIEAVNYLLSNPNVVLRTIPVEYLRAAENR